jgi:hypothetical protein
MNGLGRRLDALEQIAEECRIREYRDVLGAEITRRHAVAGLVVSPDQLNAKIDRALAIAEHMALLAASGLNLEQIAHRVALEHDLTPETVVAAFKAIQAERKA